MQIVYTPSGADPKRWDFEPNKMLNAEAEVIERLTKLTFGEWQQAIMKGSVLALHGLLYVFLKRDNPTLKWDQVVFSLSEVDLEYDDAEAEQALSNLEVAEAEGRLSETDKAMLEILRADVEERRAKAAPPEDGEPRPEA